MQFLAFDGPIERVKPGRQELDQLFNRFVVLVRDLFRFDDVFEVVIFQKAGDASVLRLRVGRDRGTKLAVSVQHSDYTHGLLVISPVQLGAALRNFLLHGDGFVCGVRCKYHAGPSSVVYRPLVRALLRTVARWGV